MIRFRGISSEDLKKAGVEIRRNPIRSTTPVVITRDASDALPVCRVAKVKARG